MTFASASHRRDPDYGHYYWACGGSAAIRSQYNPSIEPLPPKDLICRGHRQLVSRHSAIWRRLRRPENPADLWVVTAIIV